MLYPWRPQFLGSHEPLEEAALPLYDAKTQVEQYEGPMVSFERV